MRGRGDRELSIDNTPQRYDCLSSGWCCGGEKGWHTPFTTNLTMEQGPANMLLGHDLTPPLLELSDCYAHWMALYEALVWLWWPSCQEQGARERQGAKDESGCGSDNLFHNQHQPGARQSEIRPRVHFSGRQATRNSLIGDGCLPLVLIMSPSLNLCRKIRSGNETSCSKENRKTPLRSYDLHFADLTKDCLLALKSKALSVLRGAGQGALLWDTWKSIAIPNI